MAWVTVTELKARITTLKTVSELQDLLDSVKDDIESDFDTTFATVPSKIKLAHKYFSMAALLELMKTDGELPESNRAGDVQQINKIDKQIAGYKASGNSYLKSYRLSATSSTTAPYVISHVKYRECPSSDDEDAVGGSYLGR